MTGISFAIIRGIYQKYAKSGFVHVRETSGLVLLTWLQGHLFWERSSPVSLSCVTLPVPLSGGGMAGGLLSSLASQYFPNFTQWIRSVGLSQ